MEGEKKLRVICIGLGGDLKKEMKQEYYKWGCVHDKEQRAENWALGDTTEASMWEGEITIAFDTKTAKWKIGSEPV